MTTGFHESLQLPLSPELVAEWRSLERNAPFPSIFRTPDWTLARVEAMGLVEKTRVHVWRGNGGELSAVLATLPNRERFHHRIPLGMNVSTLAAAGIGGADHTGWSSDSVGHGYVSRWLEEGRESVLLRNLDPDLVVAAGLSRFAVETSRCPRLDLASWDGPSRSFRKKISYYRRRVEREGFEISGAVPGQVGKEDLLDLRRLHMERFGSDSVLPDISLRIQERLLERSDSDLGPAITRLRRGGETVAILWGLWFGGVFAFFQTGWVDAHRELSPGVILVDEAIRLARRLGATTFDFLRGPEDYKYRFGAEDRIDSTVLIPRGLAGSLLSAKEKIRQRSRTRVEE